MSVENHYFTHQVDQIFLYIHEAKIIFQRLFSAKDLLLNSSRYLPKDDL